MQRETSALRAFGLTARVADIDQDKLTFSLNGLPADATLRPGVTYGAAVLSWTPTAADAPDC